MADIACLSGRELRTGNDMLFTGSIIDDCRKLSHTSFDRSRRSPATFSIGEFNGHFGIPIPKLLDPVFVDFFADVGAVMLNMSRWAWREGANGLSELADPDG